jgi:dTDP-3-amino-2,3,6-trideoxy-4-keto-D-glucose/dTDP-3-amino-3,4,6-trideoxy-alpha-D-glucose/dTDP-2,6-dideoxy-D-kanosamine transaminase
MAAHVVPFLDLKRRHAALAATAEEALLRVARGGHYVLGPAVAEFEAAFAQRLGGGHGVGAASGTDALSLALLALGIGPGDQVLTVANVCMPVASAIRAIGADLALADCGRESRLLEPDEVGSRLGRRTRAVIAPHLYGHLLDAPTLAAVCRERGVALIEDCAQAHGARLHGREAGVWGDFGAFSFYPTKNLGAYGDGGLVYTRSAEQAERLRLLRMYGYERRDWSVLEGRNSRLDEIQAALLRVQLDCLSTWVARRRAIAGRYITEFRGLPGLGLPVERAGAEGAYHLFVVTVEARDTVRQRLSALGVETAVHYPVALHEHQVYAGAGLGSFPNSEWLSRHVLSLPCYPELDDEEVTQVIAAVRQVLS